MQLKALSLSSKWSVLFGIHIQKKLSFKKILGSNKKQNCQLKRKFRETTTSFKLLLSQGGFTRRLFKTGWFFLYTNCSGRTIWTRIRIGAKFKISFR